MTTSGLLAALILGSFFHLDMGPAMTKPVTDVPVFTGTTGSNLMKTMLPYLAKFQ